MLSLKHKREQILQRFNEERPIGSDSQTIYPYSKKDYFALVFACALTFIPAVIFLFVVVCMAIFM